MKLTVEVKTSSFHESIDRHALYHDRYKVCTRARAHNGKANAEVLRLLAHHLGVAKSNLTIIHGLRGKKKIIEVQI